MPKRSRSHELEELSVARFSELLPSKWVSRSKLPDYGIDREVEIFDAEGYSTGLAFLVQLRATDDPNRADRVRLETDELEYYRQLDLPVVIVRYCSTTDGFFWQWEAVIRGRMTLEEGQVSVTYRFSEAERWTEATPPTIARTLEVRRSLAAYPAGAAIPVRFDLTRFPATQRYQVERALGDAIGQCAGALTRPREQRLVEIEIIPEPNYLAVRIDALTSVTFDLPDADPPLIATSALYAITKLLSDKGLARQAETVARVILERGDPHHSEQLALAGCQALAGDPQAMVELAVRNDFHHQAGIAYGAILFELRRGPGPAAARTAATERFFAAALGVARAAGQTSEAAVHYSMGNHFSALRTAARAWHHYNCARKLRPTYLTADYFLRELGGLLYKAGHPSWAVKAYGAAQALDNDPFLAFLLGDALLRSGRIAEAEHQFALVIAGLSPDSTVQEAKLKQLTCQWLREETGRDRLAVDRCAGYAAMGPDGMDAASNLRRLIRDIDGLNPLAHFNLGIHCSNARAHHDALPHFLACAFVQPGDVVAWANAAICALALDEAELLVAILSVAMQHAGPDAYDHLRADLQKQGVNAEMIAQLDTVAVELIGDAQASDPEAFTMRILDGDNHEELTIIDP